MNKCVPHDLFGVFRLISLKIMTEKSSWLHECCFVCRVYDYSLNLVFTSVIKLNKLNQFGFEMIICLTGIEQQLGLILVSKLSNYWNIFYTYERESSSSSSSSYGLAKSKPLEYDVEHLQL